jgi:hypothetical protein
MVTAQDCITLTLGVEHAAGSNGRVPNFLRAADDEPALASLATAVHVIVGGDRT